MSSTSWSILSEFSDYISRHDVSESVILEATRLRKSYGNYDAVVGLELFVRRGETLGLLGPNGAGKTTTMHLLAGLLSPDDGQVKVFPASGNDRTSIGIAPQSLAVYPGLTAEENLSFFARLHGLRGPRLDERVSWGLALAGLEARRRDRVSTFSGGMKRRLNVACAAVHEPEVLLLDEPTVGVDPQSRNHLFDSFEELSAAGMTIVYSTHYMEEAQRLCDRVAIMDAGRVLAVDQVGALIRRYGGGSMVKATLLNGVDTETVLREAGLPEAVEVDGRQLVWRTPRPLSVAQALAASGIELRSLDVTSPDLETVFFALTGGGCATDGCYVGNRPQGPATAAAGSCRAVLGGGLPHPLRHPLLHGAGSRIGRRAQRRAGGGGGRG